MIAEPPGEPYYIARIMEFVYKPEDSSALSMQIAQETNEGDSPVNKRRRIIKPSRHKMADSKISAENYMVRVNWFYRPKDIQKKSTDSRLLYVTMNSDLCPIASIRGKVTVSHKEYIEDFDLYRSQPNCFWFDKLFDGYIISLFDVVPTEKIINIPLRAQKVLQERFRYAIVEAGRAKDLCASPKNCVKCTQWCSPDDSVQCAHCSNFYHMLCVDPPLERKPSRGFGWSCAMCSGAREKKLRENRGIEAARFSNGTDTNSSTPPSSNLSSEFPTSTANSGNNSTGSSPPAMTRSEELAQAFDGRVKSHKLTLEQKRQLRLWPFRYLGVHAKIEDVLDMDDRIYPRAASRLGNKHQANVSGWPGRPLVYYEHENPEKKTRRAKSTTRREPAKLVHSDSAERNEEIAELLLLDKKNRPAWLQEKPAGYIERGGDETATLMWETPEVFEVKTNAKDQFDMFLENVAGPLATTAGVEAYTPNYIDACLKAYMDCGFNDTEAAETIKLLNRKILKEPTLNAQEVARFEEGVQKFGNELHEVYKVVKTKKPADIVRFYYLWKKTPNGHKIWDNFEGRRHKMRPEYARNEGELVDNIADNNDDSKFDLTKAAELQRTFICKHCHATESDDWQRAPGYPVAGTTNPVNALCSRCARLWRRYAVVWEDPEEVIKKMAYRGSGGVKRRLEEELIEDMKAILAHRSEELERQQNRKKAKVEVKPIALVNGSGTRLGKRLSDSSPSSESSLSSPPLLSSASSGTMISELANPPAADSKLSVIDNNTSVPVARKKPGPKPGSKPGPKPRSKPGPKPGSRPGPKPGPKPGSKPEVKAEPAKSEALAETPKKPRGKPGPKPKPKNLPPPPTESQTVSSQFQLGKTSPSNVLKPSSMKRASKIVKTNVKEERKPELPLQPFLSSPIPLRSVLPSESPQSVSKIDFKKQSDINAMEPSPFKSEITRSCMVCMSRTPDDKQFKCSNCGVNVHKACYGITTEQSSATWTCDPCSNDEQPVISALYGCVLCPIRELNHEGSITGDPKARPDAVKRTFGDNWAHVRCSIWIDNLVFGDIHTMQPIEGIGSITSSTNKPCRFCGSQSNFCLECPHCDHVFHVGCADKYEYQFKIELEPAHDPSVLSIEFNNMRVIARTVILCQSAPLSPKHHAPTEIDQKTGKTLLQLYIDTYKVSRSSSIGARKRAALYATDDIFSPLGTIEPGLDDTQLGAKAAAITCSECSSKSSPIWWDCDAGSLCHICYWKQKDEEKFSKSYDTQKLSITRPASSTLRSSQPVSTSDLFKGSKFTLTPLPSSPSTSEIESVGEPQNNPKIAAFMKNLKEVENDQLKENRSGGKMSLQDILIS